MLSMLSSNSNMLMITLVFMATGLTTSYSIRLSILTLWKQPNYSPMNNINDNNILMKYPMITLTLAAIFSGFYFQFLIPDFSHTLILPIKMKLMTLMVTLFGMWMGLAIWNSKLNSTYNSTIHYTFLSSMWFLSLLSTQKPTLHSLNYSKNITKFIDQGWMEIYGGSGSSLFFQFLSIINQNTQKNLISSFITMMIIMMIITLPMIMIT